MDIDKYKRIFVQESGKYLQELNTILIRVEKDLRNRDLWSDIHGKIHSIKGMARALSLDTVSNLCHSMEAWAKEFQGESSTATADAVQVLLDGAELLKGLVAATTDGATVETSQQLERIEALLTKHPGELVDEIPPDHTRPVSAPSSIDRIRVEYSLIEELLGRSQEIILLEKTLPPLSQDQISSGLRSWIDHYISMLRGLHFQLSRLRLMPVNDFISLFEKTVRDLARTYGREVTLEISGGELQVDIGLMERLREPFLHLLRNAVAHGIEPPDEREKTGKRREGKIVFGAEKRRDSLVLTVRDDGRGIDRTTIERYLRDTLGMSDQEISGMPDEQILGTILRVDYSSAAETTQLAGRGIGMDVIASSIEYLNGSMTIHSQPLEGTEFVIALPLSLSIMYAIVFELGPYTLAVPTSHVASIEKMEIPSTGAGGEVYDLGDRLGIGPHMRNPTRIIKLRRPPSINGTLPGGTPDCFTVDAVIGNVPLMIMPSGELLAKAGSFAGIGIMENGDISILLDMEKAWEIS
ncbi:MAG: Hpt domain-containing protein [Deltaproteobacteria bacterium]|nr:Hpt domain-containing protein [Deltaproteobacteria bacterium]